MKELILTNQEAPQRVDRFLVKYLNQASKGTVHKLLRKKAIKVNGKRIKENFMLSVDDVMQIFLADDTFATLREEPKKVSAEEVDLDVVYEDSEILVLNKPVGLLTHPDKNEYKNTLATKVLYYLADLVGKTFKPAPIQRLDKNTSGLVLFAKTYESLKEYNIYMRERKIGKRYITVVEGNVKSSGEVKGFLTKDERTNRVTLSETEGEGVFVHTKYNPIKYQSGYTLCEIELLTGRSHQIRASLSWIGFPIVGDAKYGGRKVAGYPYQLLHAWKLILPNGNKIERKSSDIERFWDNLS